MVSPVSKFQSSVRPRRSDQIESATNRSFRKNNTVTREKETSQALSEDFKCFAGFPVQSLSRNEKAGLLMFKIFGTKFGIQTKSIDSSGNQAS